MDRASLHRPAERAPGGSMPCVVAGTGGSSQSPCDSSCKLVRPCCISRRGDQRLDRHAAALGTISRPYKRNFNFRFYKPIPPSLRCFINTVSTAHEPVRCAGWSLNTRTERTMLDDDDNADRPVSLPKLPAKKKGHSRRAILKAGAAATGAAIGSDLIRGFPTIWAQEIKDIELRHVGVSYSVVKAIGDQAAKDLGFKVTMQNLDTSAAINRFISQPDSVDIADLEGWQAKLAAKRSVIQGIEVKKIKEFDNILPIFTKGEIDGHKIPRQGISPYEAMYIAKPNATELHDGVTEWATFLPQVYNADSIGYRPDLIDHEVTEWKDLIDPKFKGKAAILDVPAIGIMDAALCFESASLIKYANKGNMTKQEIDFTCDKLIELKKAG